MRDILNLSTEEKDITLHKTVPVFFSLRVHRKELVAHKKDLITRLKFCSFLKSIYIYFHPDVVDILLIKQNSKSEILKVYAIRL